MVGKNLWFIDAHTSQARKSSTWHWHTHDSSSGTVKKKNEEIKQSVHTKGAILRGPYMLFNVKVCLVEPKRALYYEWNLKWGPRHYSIFNTRGGEEDLFNLIRSPKQYISIRLFFFLIIFYFMNHPNTTLFIYFLFYEPSQYDMIHDRKNQTSKQPFLLGELTSPIQLVKVYGVPSSLSHRKCLWSLSSLLVTWTWLYAS